MTTATIPPQSPQLPPAGKAADYNRIGLDFTRPMPRPKVRGTVIDFHCHLLAARHAKNWFAAADHFGIDKFVSMTPLEEALVLQRNWGDRLHFIGIPKWADVSYDDWMRRIEGFYNIGSRIIKFHMAPGTMAMRKYSLDMPEIRRIIDEAVARKMIIMSHVGDPDTWYNSSKYADTEKFGTREKHYKIWQETLEYIPPTQFWVGAHMGGNPENLPRLQSLLDRFPNLHLDCSATKWMVREISKQRDAARDFFIRNQDRLLFGSDQVSGDDRGFDFLASRFWCHRKLWETAYV
ncbi:MAG TPA: hypothetical protein VKK61_01705, partial [Tepidisphaeraceae bacterium]|nr:hypothetical protein [Tepidisphaeraceae bacterium]